LGRIEESMLIPGCAGLIWPATPQGLMLENKGAEADENFFQSVSSSKNDDGGYRLEFSVIVRFGTSIRKVTKTLADEVVSAISDRFGEHISEMVINIAGVYTKNVTKRNTRVVYHYGAD
ncbi:MAG: hypothetical protein ACI4LM_02765, partial [Anaerovoracaceae bacterium]